MDKYCLKTNSVNSDFGHRTARARAYLAHVPRAITGQGGHRTLLGAIMRLGDFGLAPEEVFEVLLEWNETCEPPWRERELAQQIRSAYRSRRRPVGCNGQTQRGNRPSIESLRRWPSEVEVGHFWASASRVSADPRASRWLAGRGLGPSEVDGRGLVRSIAGCSGTPGWARFGGRSWRTAGYELIAPLVDENGKLRSFRARRTTPDGGCPKEVAPRGFSARGLVLGNRTAIDCLAGRARPPTVIVAEGVPDWLCWSVAVDDAAVFGVFAGSWTPAHAERVPPASEVLIATDPDEAGNTYARQVRETLPSHRVFRWKPAYGGNTR